MADHLILEMDGIKGECQLEKYKNMIEITSCNISFINPADMRRGSGGSLGGRVQPQPITITKRGDAATVNLFKTIVVGETIGSVKIHYLQQGNDEEYQTIEFTDVMITSFAQSAADEGDPMESLSLTYAKIEWTYKTQENKGDLSGDIIGMYDVKAGEAN